MRRLPLHFLVLLFFLQTGILFAQAPVNQEPKFKLTIYLFQPAGALSTFREVRVAETNISNEEFSEEGCMEFRGIFKISILYNGLPLAEKDETARIEREARAKHTGCTWARGVNKIGPGVSWDRYLSLVDYDISKPGTYEITVSRESDLDHPENSVTVKSNTLTVVVPEPEANELK